MTASRGGRRPGDSGWLEWEPDGETTSTDAGTGGGDERPEDPAHPDAGPWLRPELTADTAQRAGDAPRAPWLDPELDVPSSAAQASDVEDTGVPPTLAEDAPAAPRAPQPVASSQPPVQPSQPPVPPSQPPVAQTQPQQPTPVTAAAVPHATAADVEEETDTRAARRGHRRKQSDHAGGLAVVAAAVKEFAIVVGMALVLSFVVKTWFLQAFYIPSGSMEDTLQVNDRVIVSKLTPGPFDLKRGDIVVFGDPGDWLDPVAQEDHNRFVTAVRDTLMFVGLLPDDSENHLIKRVIGLPGDTVACCDEGGHLTVNGAPVNEPYLKPGVAPSDSEFKITVPRGRVWVMGDNRSGSGDSRAHDYPDNDGRTGSVDERLIVGRAVALVWPLNHFTLLSTPSEAFKDVPDPKPTEVEEPPPADDPGSDSDPAPSESGGGEVSSEGGG